MRPSKPIDRFSYFHLPTLPDKWLQIFVRFLVVREASVPAVPHQLAGHPQGDRAERQPLDVLRRRAELRDSRSAALTRADPVLLMVDAALEHLRRKLIL